MDGYFDDPDATAEALRDGWYHTGDLGALDDDGYLSIVGRARDVIRTGGETVAPAEVEAGARPTHPDVAEVAVVGVPDAQWGEVVTAVVVAARRRATAPDVDALRAFCDGRLAPFKHPRRRRGRRRAPPHRRHRPGPAHPDRRTPPRRPPDSPNRRHAPSALTVSCALRRCAGIVFRCAERCSGRADSVEAALADRALAERRDAYAAEVRRLIDAAFVVMRRTGSIDPQVRDIVQEAGLSNQAFYRHFASKDALLLAVLADGQRQLVAYLERRLARPTDPAEQVRRWIDGVMAQARDRDAAAATRPFAINGARLADQFPDEVAASRAELLDLAARRRCTRSAATTDDVELVHDLTIGAHARRDRATAAAPTAREVQRLVRFCLAGITEVTRWNVKLLITGIGGQGVQLAAQVLARGGDARGPRGHVPRPLRRHDARRQHRQHRRRRRRADRGAAGRVAHVVGDRDARRVLGAGRAEAAARAVSCS